ncbi:RNA polymerase sigma factor SigJ [Nocardia mexicana]|uniref:RNA polymerase sigma-70 factor (ECF subfamily) n=1 Tax=Nocardia mexicana TaxID=279262 RepID=A0A370GFN8_9NOCA|nr:RNA polymerase sigma factor SigJ [Nocardia mexicana]RDI42481.1 RNA polymerase sigma-70 factor (ECF subfamily) [Nocardia mexicana]
MTSTGSAGDTVTEQFLDHRELLFAVAYNMLGSVSDTEDVLQEVWLGWAARHRAPDAESVENVRAYLTRTTVNQALARRVDMNRRRETYVGCWLPEPLLATSDDTAGAVERAESLSMAMLVVLETLSPLERAVFVLHDVFGFGHPEIAAMLDRSPAAVRQLASRARTRVHSGRPRHRAAPETRAEVTERFVAAAVGGDLRALLEVLAPEVTVWTDGGGKGPAASLRPIQGRDRVADLFMSIAAALPAGIQVRYGRASADAYALVFSGESLLAVLVVDLAPAGDRVTGIYSITNPDKLTGVR